MSMKKKALSALAALVLLSCTGCGKEPAPAPAVPESAPAVPEVVQPEQAEPQPEPEPEPIVKTAQASIAKAIAVNKSSITPIIKNPYVLKFFRFQP